MNLTKSDFNVYYNVRDIQNYLYLLIRAEGHYGIDNGFTTERKKTSVDKKENMFFESHEGAGKPTPLSGK